MTLLGKNDGANALDGSGYLDLASFIRKYGGNVKKDLRELWRKLAEKYGISRSEIESMSPAFDMRYKS